MAYTFTNYQYKKDLVKDFQDGVKIRCFQPGPFGHVSLHSCEVYLEGPHYPKPHRWYAKATVNQRGIITSID